MPINNNKEIDHKYTENAVCPHCGYEHSDSRERDDGGGAVDCEEC